MGGIRKIFRRVLQLNDTPESIARGAVIGLVIAMIPPPFWFQSLVALGMAWILRANRLAAVMMTFVTNPLTFYIYLINYAVGLPILKFTVGWKAPSIAEVWKWFEAAESLWDYAQKIGKIGMDIFVPMTVGGLLTGTVLAVPLYIHMKRWVIERRLRRVALAEGDKGGNTEGGAE